MDVVSDTQATGASDWRARAGFGASNLFTSKMLAVQSVAFSAIPL